MKFEIKIPKYANFILKHLNSCGFEAFVVGGCVRDSFRGCTPLDWDICTNASPEQTVEVFRNVLPVIPTGIQHGTVTVLSQNIPVEVTTYRSDGEYNDNRHPEKVKFLDSVSDDLARRDFTVNAMAYHPTVGLIDPFGGISDIEAKTIRCVGEAEVRFCEDALRIMRALRFSAVCGFSIEPNTATAIHKCSPLLANISAERILSELKKLLLADKPSSILLGYRDIFEKFIPHLPEEYYLKMTDILPKDISLRLAALLGGIKKSDASALMRGLKADNALRKNVCCIAEFSDMPLPDTKSEIKKMLYTHGAESTRNIIIFKSAKETVLNHSNTKSRHVLSCIDDIINGGECYSLSGLCINGSDLIGEGIAEGKEIGVILDKLLTAVIDEKVENDKSALLKAARAMRLP